MHATVLSKTQSEESQLTSTSFDALEEISAWDFSPHFLALGWRPVPLSLYDDCHACGFDACRVCIKTRDIWNHLMACL